MNERLKRITAGEYRTVSGDFTVLHDPGRSVGLPDAWLLYEGDGLSGEGMIERYPTLAVARLHIPRWRRAIAEGRLKG